jgi:hypothetical protein
MTGKEFWLFDHFHEPKGEESLTQNQVRALKYYHYNHNDG